jgi:hypothetical protein
VNTLFDDADDEDAAHVRNTSPAKTAASNVIDDDFMADAEAILRQ